MSATTVHRVALAAAPLDRLVTVAPERQFDELCRVADRARDCMQGRRLWNVNSTEKGGGVAEMLTCQLPYLRGAGIDTHWIVVDADDDFFRVSKRIHNQLHGNPGDGCGLGEADRRTYEATLARNAEALGDEIAPGDVVLLHDPQTAGLIPWLERRGAIVAWRCHVGVDEPNRIARAAWDFLRPYVARAQRHVFTCRGHVWSGLDPDRLMIVAPSIDPFTPKNQPIEDETAAAIIRAAGIVDDDNTRAATPTFMRRDGERDRVERRVDVTGGPVPARVPIVMQLSRWDRLKDHIGVLRGFVEHVIPTTDAHLVLAGPQADSVDDDPEQAEILGELCAAWDSLDPDEQGRVHIVALPMDDEDENGAIVNALQRRSTIVVQKSLAEGFGLTVAEAMWKRRPTVASARGGITAQVEDGKTGVLLHDPTDTTELGAALTGLLRDRHRADQLAAAGHEHVREHFLTSRELTQQLELIEDLVAHATA